MSYDQINQSYELSHNKTLLLSYQEVPKDKDYLLLFKRE